MQIAQWEADAIAAGAPGHTRPPGLTLGQWMISFGYPLSGSIALDGLRSENWVGGREMTVDQAIISWLGDAPHTNTMLSPSRSDIGAGVAVVQDDLGTLKYYYVIETALQTSDGQQQVEALVLLTALPQTQSADYGDATQAAAALSVPQYMIPVSVATARPDGDVIHEIKYGQPLWSIAIAYGVKIEEIKRLNNFTDNEVWPNQIILIQKSATQPVPTESATPSPTAGETSFLPSPTASVTPTPKATAVEVESSSNLISTLTLYIVLIVLILGSIVWLFLKEFRPPPHLPPTP
jgi:LysM repeat protein